MPDQTKYTGRLSGSRVLIIGGSSGLGFGVAEAVIEHGAAEVIISSSQQSRIDSAIDRLKKSYPSTKAEVKGYACDLGNEDTLESNIEQLFSEIGQLDHIVFSAGDKIASKPLQDVDFKFIKQAGMVRFYAPLLVAKVGSKHLAGGRASSIVLTTGAVSEHPIPDWTVVGSFAAGAQAMTRGLALDLKPIRVNLISPGGVDTELWNSMAEDKRKAMMESMGKHTATGQIGQVVDVVEAYLYCMRDQNLTGTMISTNGGSLIL